jgi:cell division protein FtsL
LRSAYAINQPVHNAYLVRERDRRRRRELLLVLLAMLPVGLALIGYVWVQHELMQIGYRVSDLEEELRELTRSHRQLELEAEIEMSPARIEERARRELGLQQRTLQQMRFLGGSE